MNRHCDGKMAYISKTAAEAALLASGLDGAVVSCGRHFHLSNRKVIEIVVGA